MIDTVSYCVLMGFIVILPAVVSWVNCLIEEIEEDLFYIDLAIASNTVYFTRSN